MAFDNNTASPSDCRKGYYWRWIGKCCWHSPVILQRLAYQNQVGDFAGGLGDWSTFWMRARRCLTAWSSCLRAPSGFLPLSFHSETIASMYLRACFRSFRKAALFVKHIFYTPGHA